MLTNVGGWCGPFPVWGVALGSPTSASGLGVVESRCASESETPLSELEADPVDELHAARANRMPNSHFGVLLTSMFIADTRRSPQGPRALSPSFAANRRDGKKCRSMSYDASRTRPPTGGVVRSALVQRATHAIY